MTVIPMKILVTGATGQLGTDVIKELESRCISCKGVDMADFDICSAEQVRGYITAYAPDAVIHCAAYTAVDRAENERGICMRVNAGGTENIARVCGEIGAGIVYISTDYVFGDNGDGLLETDFPAAPLNVYGESKLGGENAVRQYTDKHFIVRTSWVFGAHGNNFVKTMCRLGAEREKICVVSDQTGSPTYTRDLARLVCDMVCTEKYGTYHATNEDFCSWADFADEIMQFAGLPAKIIRVSTEEYNAVAKRQKNSRLSKASLDANGFSRLPGWKDALKRYFDEIEV